MILVFFQSLIKAAQIAVAIFGGIGGRHCECFRHGLDLLPTRFGFASAHVGVLQVVRCHVERSLGFGAFPVLGRIQILGFAFADAWFDVAHTGITSLLQFSFFAYLAMSAVCLTRMIWQT